MTWNSLAKTVSSCMQDTLGQRDHPQKRASPLAGGDQLPSRDRGLGEAGEVAGLSLRQNTLGGTLLSPLRKLAQM